LTKKKDSPQWRPLGYTKDGKPKPPRTKPKRQLSERETRVLCILENDKIDSAEKSLTMREVYARYLKKWPEDDYGHNLCSDNLEKLQQSWFVTMLPATQALVNRSTEAIRPIKKARFYLSEMALSGALKIDTSRWVILNGDYIASEKTRKRKDQRQAV